MLSVRLAVFAAIAGVSLWGLFSLLENLKEPELLRSRKAIVVKGCEPMESPEARQLCPHLFCQKVLLERQWVPLSTRFTIEVDRARDGLHLIGGSAVAQANLAGVSFACVLEEGRVSAAKIVNAEELTALNSDEADWSL